MVREIERGGGNKDSIVGRKMLAAYILSGLLGSECG